ncbi:MAG TPA: zinc ribbon domain-containing protein [Candidatus Limosilactobacillus faecipullorum]|nr:zinc ribbon domain-containing protein [Candidatus Limosilactobacillus faecipullorum]
MNINYCSYCGKKIPSSTSFCPYCGKKVLQKIVPTSINSNRLLIKTNNFNDVILSKLITISVAITMSFLFILIYFWWRSSAITPIISSVIIIISFALSIHLIPKFGTAKFHIIFSILSLIAIFVYNIATYNILFVYASYIFASFSFGIGLATIFNSNINLKLFNISILAFGISLLLIFSLDSSMNGISSFFSDKIFGKDRIYDMSDFMFFTFIAITHIIFLFIPMLGVNLITIFSKLSDHTTPTYKLPNWNISSKFPLNLVLWAILGYLLATGPDLFTEKNLSYIYEDYYDYSYTLLLWIGIALGILVSSLIQLSITKFKEKLPTTLFTFMIGEIIQIIGVFIMWNSFDSSAVQPFIVGIGSGISSFSIIVLLLNITLSDHDILPTHLLLGIIVATIVFWLIHTFSLSFFALIVLESIITFLSIPCAILSFSNIDPLKVSQKLFIE